MTDAGQSGDAGLDGGKPKDNRQDVGKPDAAVTIPPEVAEMHVRKGMSLQRAWREHLGLTREEAAARMGTSPAAYAQMESKNAKPRVATLKKIAAALGVEWEQLRD